MLIVCHVCYVESLPKEDPFTNIVAIHVCTNDVVFLLSSNQLFLYAFFFDVSARIIPLNCLTSGNVERATFAFVFNKQKDFASPHLRVSPIKLLNAQCLFVVCGLNVTLYIACKMLQR